MDSHSCLPLLAQTPRRKSRATFSTRSLKVGQTVTSALTAAIQASSWSKVDPSSHSYAAHAHTSLQRQPELISPQSVAEHGGQSMQVIESYWTSARIRAYKAPGTSLWTRYTFLADTTMKMLRARIYVGFTWMYSSLSPLQAGTSLHDQAHTSSPVMSAQAGPSCSITGGLTTDCHDSDSDSSSSIQGSWNKFHASTTRTLRTRMSVGCLICVSVDLHLLRTIL
jgi:hypothetical protein